MKILQQQLDCLLIDTNVIDDQRGWFNVTFEESFFASLGFKGVCQLNHSYTIKKGIIRGPNYQQRPYHQNKIVRCIKGKLYSIAIDLDQSSPNYKKWCGFVLDSKDHYVMYIPNHYAHGFISMEDETELEYFTDAKYDGKSAKSFFYNDPEIQIDWSLGGSIEVDTSILSDKNRYAPLFKEIEF